MNKDIEEIKKNPKIYTKKLDVKKIVKILKYASDIYYSTDEPIFSDRIYDIIVDILYKKDPKNKFLKTVGSSLMKINKVKLPYYMSSLDKIKLDNRYFNIWIKTYNGPYHISEKLDGISGLLHYKNNKISLYTRGDGYNGMDISFLLKDVRGIKNVKLEEIAIRGELILEKSDITKDMKNGRNTVAGIVNSKKNNYNRNIARKIKFVAYEIMYPKYKVSEQMILLNKLKFNTPYNILVKKLSIEYLNKLLLDRRDKSFFEIDGLVVRDNNIHKMIKGKNPKYAFAYKTIMGEQIRETKIIDIRWEISKDKILVPVIIFEKIKLGGVDIQRTTGFNAKYIKDKLLNKGSIIEIIRSGDVIPYINKIIKKSKEWLRPNINYEWTDTGVDIIAIFDGKKDSDKYKKKYEIVLITNFFNVLGARNISIGIITKLYNGGYDTIKKILRMRINDFLKIGGVGEKMAKKLYNSIKMSINDVKISTLMSATNIFGKGWNIKKFDLLLRNIPYNKLIKLDKKQMFDKINGIKGFSDKSSRRFTERIGIFIKFIKSNIFFSMLK